MLCRARPPFLMPCVSDVISVFDALCIGCHILAIGTLFISLLVLYRMDLNFRGTKLLRIENFRVFCVFIFADARPTILYGVYRLYICTKCALGCAKS